MSRVTFTPSPGESAGGEWAWSGEGLAGHTIDSCPSRSNMVVVGNSEWHPIQWRCNCIYCNTQSLWYSCDSRNVWLSVLFPCVSTPLAMAMQTLDPKGAEARITNVYILLHPPPIRVWFALGVSLAYHAECIKHTSPFTVTIPCNEADVTVKCILHPTRSVCLTNHQARLLH